MNENYDRLNPELKYTMPPRFGDSMSEVRYVGLCDAQRRRTFFEYSVAPSCHVRSMFSGKELNEGDEITFRDTDGPAGMDLLVRTGAVLRIPATSAAGRKPEPHHTHRVTTVSATISRTRGVLDCGVTCSKEDWAEPARPPIADRATGEVAPGRPAQDGSAAVADLVARGILEPLEPAKTASKGKAA